MKLNRYFALCATGFAFLVAAATPSQAQFTQKFDDQTRGDIVLAGNVLVRPTNVNAVDNNNELAAKVDVDGNNTTDNSSSAVVRIPAGAKILSARLYWQSRVAAINTGAKTIKLSTTGAAGGYQTVTSSAVTSLNTGNGIIYSAQADVTGILKNVTSFPATILAGGAQVEVINDSTGSYAGWGIVIAYQSVSEPIRQLRIFDGFSTVSGNSVDTSITGFRTPDAGAFDVKLGVMAFEGDRGLGGDQFLVSKDGTTYSQVSDAVNPATNFFNSTISQDGVSFANSLLNPSLRNPGTDPANYNNSIGLDIDRVTLSGPGTYFNNNQTSLGLRFISTGDVYQVTTFTTSIPTAEILGRVYDDKNYGGSVGRAFDATQGMAGVAGTRVELYTSAGAFIRASTTDSNGIYSFSNLGSSDPSTDYLVRVVNNTVVSSRGPAVTGLVPVQTFCTEAKSSIDPTTLSANPTPVTNKVGGENPALADAAAVTTVGAAIPTDAQSVTRVQLGLDPVTGVDFGFNFDTIVNTNDAGQGSLRQFILNSNALSNAGLAQNNQTAGQEVSIFRIPATDARYSANGPARIVLATPLDAITGTNAAQTIVDGATQTTNVANTNTATLGVSSGVGTGSRSVSPLNGPEIEVSGNGTLATLLTIGAASDVTVKNLAFTGQNSAAAPGNVSAIVIGGATNPTITGNVFGATTTTAGAPAATTRVSEGILFGAAPVTNVTITGNVFSQMGNRAIVAGAVNFNQVVNGLLIEGNQILTTGSQMNGNQTAGEAIYFVNSFQKVVVRGNLFDGIALGNANSAFGDNVMEVFFNVAGSAVGGFSIEDNTLRNSRGTGITMYDNAAAGGNSNGKSIVVTRNVVQNMVAAGGVGGSGIEVLGARSVQISQNSFYGNGSLAIDLGTGFGATVGTGKGVSPNDGAKVFNTNTGNGGMDYPIFTTVQQNGANLRVIGYIGNLATGSATFANAQIEFYIADNTPANQDGPVILGDGLSLPHGEGRTFIGTGTANGQGLFDVTLSGTALGSNQITAIAIDNTGNTSEFNNNAALSSTISGTVYLDSNRNATFDSSESGTNINNLFVKAVLAGQSSAAQAVPVAAATGAFQFSALAPGNYTLVLDDNATLTDITPAIPANYVGTESPNGTRQLTVTNQAILNQNFGLFNGAQISGNVFEDGGAGTGPGLGGVKVNLTKADGTLVDTTITDASGNFSFRVPNSVGAGVLKVVEFNLSGTNSVSGDVGTTGATGAYDLPTDTISFTYAAGSTYTGLKFGDSRGITFVNEDAKTGTAGSSVFYPHVFTSQATGTVTFTTTQLPTPANSAWSVVTFRDSNGNGQLDGGDAQITGPVTVVAGTPITIFLQNFIPTTAANGAQDKLTVTANFTPTTGAVQSISRSDLTTVAANQGLLLTKAVNTATAKSGDVLTYTITYRNTGAEALTNLVVKDATPAYTTFVSAANGALPPGLTAPTITAPAVAAKGAVTWTFGGTLNPNQSGTVTFNVKVQ